MDGSDPKPLTAAVADDFMPEVSPDGRMLALARGSHTRDAVLINDVK
jgi:Tol biopolymer transport system component